MAKMTCYVVSNYDDGIEVFLDEQEAIHSFYKQLDAWDIPDNKIEKWIDEYNRDKCVLADVFGNGIYFCSLAQTVLNY